MHKVLVLKAWKLFALLPELLPHDHFDGVDPVAQSFVMWDGIGDTSIFIRNVRGELSPLSHRRVLHDINVNLLPSQGDHVEGSVHESGLEYLR